MTSASVYIHIPWCRTRCPYCDFNTYAATQWPERAYADALAAEVAWFCERPPFDSVTLSTVFFGGGTPSLFAPATIERILQGLAHNFRLDDELEITLEANPGTVDRKHLADLRKAGINRLSLGIQSFQPRLLQALGREHSVEESRQALGAARAAGFDNLSLDLIYATPTQTLAELEADLQEATTIAPEHVSAYALTYEAGTPMHRDLTRGRIERASEELEATMFETVRDRLSSANYHAYEISSHARPDGEARHNQAYWRGGPYLGLGAGAHSFSPDRSPVGSDEGFGVRWQNQRDPGHYRQSVQEGGHAVQETESRNRGQAIGEYCWLSLREARGIEIREFARLFGSSLDKTFPSLEGFVEEGLLEECDGRLSLTGRGLLVADSIFASFF